MVRRTGKGESPGPRGSESDLDDEVLRAKYLDYCSARICDVFMGLDAEQVFELAKAAEQKAGAAQGTLSFREIASVLVDQLYEDMALPDFNAWAADYRKDPEAYDPYLLGLWKSYLESHARSR